MQDGAVGRTMTGRDGLRHVVTTGSWGRVILCDGYVVEPRDDVSSMHIPTCLQCWHVIITSKWRWLC